MGGPPPGQICPVNNTSPRVQLRATTQRSCGPGKSCGQLGVVFSLRREGKKRSAPGVLADRGPIGSRSEEPDCLNSSASRSAGQMESRGTPTAGGRIATPPPIERLVRVSHLGYNLEPRTSWRPKHGQAQENRDAARPSKAEPIKTGMIRARIDPDLKDRAETILGNLGLNASDAIRLFYTQITLNDGLPFPVKVPNAETIQAIRDAEAGQGTRYASAAEMFKKMGL